MITHAGQESASRAPAFRIRGAHAPKPTLARRFVDTHDDALFYLLGLCLALVVAPIAEFLLTGESTVLRFICAMETPLSPEAGPATLRRAGALPESRSPGRRTAETVSLAGRSSGSSRERLSLSLRDGVGSAASSNGAYAEAASPAASAGLAARGIRSSPAAAFSARGAMAQAAAMKSRAAPEGAKTAAETLGPRLETLSSADQGSWAGKPEGHEARADKPRLVLQKGLDPNFQDKIKTLWKGDAGSSVNKSAAASGSALTLREAAAASLASSQEASRQAGILQQMAEGINTDFEGPWEKDPILAPLHADLVQAKTAALSAAGVMQGYAGQLEKQSTNLTTDARAFAAYARNPRGDPPAVTARAVENPPDVSAQMGAVSDSIGDIQRMIDRLESPGRSP